MYSAILPGLSLVLKGNAPRLASGFSAVALTTAIFYLLDQNPLLSGATGAFIVRIAAFVCVFASSLPTGGRPSLEKVLGRRRPLRLLSVVAYRCGDTVAVSVFIAVGLIS